MIQKDKISIFSLPAGFRIILTKDTKNLSLIINPPELIVHPEKIFFDSKEVFFIQRNFPLSI